MTPASLTSPPSAAAPGQPAVAAPQWTPHALLRGATYAAFVAAAVRLAIARPQIGGVDFAYYVVNARDVLDGYGADVTARYAYSPGVYAFWGAVQRVGRDVAALQSGALGMLWLLGIATALCTLAVTRRTWLAALGGALTLALLPRLEGLEGTTEPLVAVPFLLGMAAFTHLWRAGRPRRAVAVLGVCTALAFFMKQQGGLLGMGAAVGLLWPLWQQGPRRAGALVAIGLATTLASILGLWALDGGGVPALLQAFGGASSYPAQGTFASNMGSVAARVPALFPVGCALTAGLALLWASDRARLVTLLRTCEASAAIAVACAAAAGLVQFAVRSYAHYALLVLPCVVVALRFCLAALLDALARGGTTRLLQPTVVAALLALALATAYGIVRNEVKPNFADALARFAPLCAALRPGEPLLVVPPRENGVHLLCGTRGAGRAEGYGFTAANQTDAALIALLPDFPTLAFVGTPPAAVRTQAVAIGFQPVFEQLDLLLMRNPAR